MKKLVCTFALAVAFSSSAVAAPSLHDHCKLAGKMAESSLAVAKRGLNPAEDLMSNPERNENVDSHTLLVMLAVKLDVWENRNVYSKVRAYAAGYKICMELT